MSKLLMKRAFVAVLLGTAPAVFLDSAEAATVDLLDVGNRLITIDSGTPGAITSTVVLTGINGNETLLGFDYRPSSPRVLYGLSTAGQVYAINPRNGSATAIGTPVTINGTAAGIDFNPAVDRIRVVTNTNQNLRINADTGALAAADAPLAYAAADPGAGTAPRVSGAAYSNNTPGTPSTTLYVIDTNRGVLATQGSPGGTPTSPNSGQLFTVGSLGVMSNDNVGFDIGRDGTVLASFTQPGTGTTSLYTVNLATGAATLIGVIGAGGHTYLGLAIAPAPIASYGITANQIILGNALDSFTGAPSGGLNSLFISLDGLAPTDRAAALSQLTPSAFSLLPQLTLRTVELQEAAVQRYLRDFRNGAAGNTLAGGKLGGFLVFSGREGHFDAATDRARINYGGVGVVGGLDYRLDDHTLIGVVGGYDRTDANLGNFVPASSIKSYFGGGYATLGYGPAYVDVFGTYGKADYDLRRNVRFGATALDFASATRSRTYVGGGTIGLKFGFGIAEIEPYAGIRYAHVKIDSFSEGSSVGALSLGDDRYEALLGNFGARVGFNIPVGDVVVRPEIRGAYRREFRHDGDATFSYSFAGPGVGSLQFNPTPLARGYATAGAGLTISGTRSPLAIVVDYNGEFASDRRIHGITGGLRLAF